MEAKKEFLRMINECDEIALATSIHDFPNVRIVNYYYDEKNNVMYFATYTGREKISEFWKNNNVSFTTIPVNKGKREHIRARGHVRESEKSIIDLRDEFSNKMADFAEIIDKYSKELKVYEIKFSEVTVTLDSRYYEKVNLQ
ncbi:pyridoxamine 5'-phosphate oxidase family protein [Fusobacterium simiae]|uniref:Pyridoxamine 5'-phosphate oxidase family protein n=1 Tax=Fusobacterium simiae TaxID=855 RepID=A0ABT4DIE8_FUSSI|nr:pyridoxamine 5'-phosphate oxidase family protein [Fusobacterium simiae]MCY7008385.1 pyridoxamine 5'-phosphate oxidase family protein [Fusobacterium simiae]